MRAQKPRFAECKMQNAECRIAENFFRIYCASANRALRKVHPICRKLSAHGRGECRRMRSFGCATLRAAPLRMTERARFARNPKSLARGKITLLPQRTQFAVNVRLTEGVKPRDSKNESRNKIQGLPKIAAKRDFWERGATSASTRRGKRQCAARTHCLVATSGEGKSVRVSPPYRANRSISFARFARNHPFVNPFTSSANNRSAPPPCPTARRTR